jgi:beta-N-acetylhexosaminidase
MKETFLIVKQFLSRFMCVALAFMMILNTLSTQAVPPVHLDRRGQQWAATTLRKMKLEEKIGQMIMPWARIEFMNVNSAEYLQHIEEMRKYHVGGFGVTVFTDGAALLKSEPLEAAALTNSLQAQSKYPLLFAADFERGLSMRLNGATSFPPAMAFGATGDTQLARRFGSITAREARAVGVQWNWFPVADVNSNPANPIINTRSFGEDPNQVGAMVAAYIIGARSQGLLTTVKHFPGHGDTDTDSHLALPRTTATMERLNTLELIPFKSAIAAGVDSVMVAHITAPAIEPDANLPASISSKVITGLLKEQLGFHGLVVTDALDMGGLTHSFSGTLAEISGEEAVAAIRAGNDMVIIPGDLDGAYNGLLNAVKKGVLSQKRIDESVLKILDAKASVGLDRDRFVDLGAVNHEVAVPEAVATAQEISDRAVTLVSDANQLLPLKLKPGPVDGDRSGVLAVIFTDNARTSEGGRAFARLLRERAPGSTVLFVDDANSSYIAPQVLAALASAKNVIAIAEAVPSARRVTQGQMGGSAGLEQNAGQVLTSLLKAAGSRTVFVAFGNPYVGAQMPDIATYLCTFSNTPQSAASLIKALWGEMAIRGHLPVTIPGVALRGSGIDSPKTEK